MKKVNYNSGIDHLTVKEFHDLASVIYDQCGITLPIAKKTMLESRLAKRLRALNIPSFIEYIAYLLSKDGIENEMIHMIDVVTTNKTDFFREPHHFDFLLQESVQEFLKNKEVNKPFHVWSSACSTGEEPYTIAMVLQQVRQQQPGFDYHIMASDISTEVLQKAVTAVYRPDRIEGIPMALKKKYFLKSKNTTNPTVRLVKEIRDKIHFQRLNLMDRMLAIDGVFDVIFCRNVLIYFDKQTQQDVIRKLTDKLKIGGYLFIGHSETLQQMDLQLTQIKPTVYKKNNDHE